MSSKLLFNLGRLASNDNDCSLNENEAIENQRQAWGLCYLLNSWLAEDCVYADRAWIPGSMCQKTLSGQRPVAGCNIQL